MILETCRAVTDWLNDVTHGVAAQLLLTPLESGDTVPAIGTIADETRDNLVAQGRLPSTPGISVNSAGVKALDPEVAQVTRDGQVTLHIRFGVAADDTDGAMRDTSYVLRAVLRSLRLFNAATRSRNQIDIYSCEELRIVALWTEKDGQTSTGAVITTLQCRDLAP